MSSNPHCCSLEQDSKAVRLYWSLSHLLVTFKKELAAEWIYKSKVCRPFNHPVMDFIYASRNIKPKQNRFRYRYGQREVTWTTWSATEVELPYKFMQIYLHFFIWFQKEHKINLVLDDAILLFLFRIFTIFTKHVYHVINDLLTIQSAVKPRKSGYSEVTVI